MAVASTKSRWETGEVQAQSSAKSPACKVGSHPGARLGSLWKASVRLSRLKYGQRALWCMGDGVSARLAPVEGCVGRLLGQVKMDHVTFPSRPLPLDCHPRRQVCGPRGLGPARPGRRSDQGSKPPSQGSAPVTWPPSAPRIL